MYYSKHCSKCKKCVDHPLEMCANLEKYCKSSKAMESIGSVDIVLLMGNKCTTCYVATIVTDEDFTTISKLSRCMRLILWMSIK